MPKLKVPPYPHKGKTFTLKWAQKKMKEYGLTPITEEDYKCDSGLRDSFGMPKT